MRGERWRGESWWGNREENTLRNENIEMRVTIILHYVQLYVDEFLASERDFSYVFIEHYGMWSHHHE